MTTPEVDVADRAMNNMESFIHKHRAELFNICVVVHKDPEVVLLDMLMSGFEVIRNEVQQALEVSNEEWAEVAESTDNILKIMEEVMQ